MEFRNTNETALEPTMFWFVPFGQTMNKQHRTYLWLTSSLRHALPPRFLPKPSLILLFCLTARQLGLFCFPGTLFYSRSLSRGFRLIRNFLRLHLRLLLH